MSELKPVEVKVGEKEVPQPKAPTLPPKQQPTAPAPKPKPQPTQPQQQQQQTKPVLKQEEQASEQLQQWRLPLAATVGAIILAILAIAYVYVLRHYDLSRLV